MANTSVTSGNVQPGGTLSSGDTLYILDGGVATQTVVLAGGQQVVSSGGTAFSATISSGGDEIVSGGGEDRYGDVQAGGTLDFFAGGIGSNTVIESGGTLALDLVTVASGTVITAGPRTAISAISGIQLSAGAIVGYDAVTVASGATVRVASGGTVSGAAVLSGGTVNVVSHGSAAGLTVGGQLYDLGGTVSGATILSGGLLEVVSSTLDLNTQQDVAQSSPISTVSVSSGGTFQVDGALNGAQAVAAGAGVVVSGGATYRLYQATIDNVAVIDRQISATVTSGGLILLSGAVATTVSALVEGSGTLTISSGATDSASTAGDGGRIIVSSGGFAIDNKAIFLGEITILSGGIASGLVVNGSNTDDGIIAGVTVMSGGIVSGGEIQLGSAVVEPGAIIAGLSILSRSTLDLNNSVVAAGQTVREGATGSARTVSGAILSSGALLNVFFADVQSGGTLVLAGSQTRQLIVEAGGFAGGGGAVYDPNGPFETDPTSSFVAGTVTGTELDMPVVVQSGGVLSSVTAAAAPGATVGTFTIGAVTIQAGGLASRLTLTTSYGRIPDLTVQSGGHASSVVLNGGNATALAGSVVSGLTANYGRFTPERGCFRHGARQQRAGGGLSWSGRHRCQDRQRRRADGVRVRPRLRHHRQQRRHADSVLRRHRVGRHRAQRGAAVHRGEWHGHRHRHHRRWHDRHRQRGIRGRRHGPVRSSGRCGDHRRERDILHAATLGRLHRGSVRPGTSQRRIHPAHDGRRLLLPRHADPDRPGRGGGREAGNRGYGDHRGR